MTEVISSFKGKHAFLSNFWPHAVHPFWWPLTLPSFPTNEHLFQAWKAESNNHLGWLLTVEEIRSADSPGQAKYLGQRVRLRSDWENIKINVMRYCVEIKFNQNESEQGDSLRKALLDTGDADLIEGNTWGDRFWGATWDKELGWVGHNWLGKILMEEREALR